MIVSIPLSYLWLLHGTNLRERERKIKARREKKSEREREKERESVCECVISRPCCSSSEGAMGGECSGDA